jgi:CBS domain-containing protein
MPTWKGRCGSSQRKSTDDMSLLYNPIRSLIKRSPVVCTPELTVREAAEVMTLERIGSIVVIDEQHRPIGILTDTDMRARSCGKKHSYGHTHFKSHVSARCNH